MMINGSLHGFFRSSRGLRQGDPLSSYLFVIIMEAFSHMVLQALDGGFLFTCSVRGSGVGGVRISHLLFADDVLIFFKDYQDQLTFLCWISMWFEALLGLKINLEKSVLIPMGRVENVEALATGLDCKVEVYLPPIWGFRWVLVTSQ